MSYGPIELVFIGFPGNRFTGEIAPAIDELVGAGTIRIIDLLFVSKDADGRVDIVEIDGLGDELYATFDPLAAELAGLLSEDDARYFAATLEPDSSAAVLLLENTWASRVAEAIRAAKGVVLVNERIPRSLVEEVVAATSPAA